MAGLTVDVDNWSGRMMGDEVLAYLRGEQGNISGRHPGNGEVIEE